MRLNLNTATQSELAAIHGIGEKRAESIINYRSRHGQFNKKSDLRSVPGIGDKTYNAVKDRLYVQKRTVKDEHTLVREHGDGLARAGKEQNIVVIDLADDDDDDDDEAHTGRQEMEYEEVSGTEISSTSGEVEVREVHGELSRERAAAETAQSYAERFVTLFFTTLNGSCNPRAIADLRLFSEDVLMRILWRASDSYDDLRGADAVNAWYASEVSAQGVVFHVDSTRGDYNEQGVLVVEAKGTVGVKGVMKGEFRKCFWLRKSSDGNWIIRRVALDALMR